MLVGGVDDGRGGRWDRVAQGGVGPLLLVANQGGHTLNLIDSAAGRQIDAGNKADGLTWVR